MATLEIITGPMFSGKSEELIRRLRRETYAEKKILIVKPAIDFRSDGIEARQKVGDKFSSALKLPAISVCKEKDLILLIEKENPQVLVIDESQFFGKWFAEFIFNLLDKKDLRIICAGLDLDAWGKPFGSMPELMAMANDIKKETAVCFSCRKNSGTMTFKKSGGSGLIEIGNAELYEARCRECWRRPE